MNTHILSGHHLHWHWMESMCHKMNLAIHNPKMWAIISVCALVAALIFLAMIASTMEGEPTMPYYYDYPLYPQAAP